MADQALPKLIAYALSEQVRNYPRTDLIEHLRTAEDWHGGPRSMMLKFARNEGILDGGIEYSKLYREVRKALKECKLQGQHAKLIALQNFAIHQSALERTLKKVSKEIQRLGPFKLDSRLVQALVNHSL